MIKYIVWMNENVIITSFVLLVDANKICACPLKATMLEQDCKVLH